ncbi:MAG: ATP-dependent DNA helicase, partial [Gammaproteobacteria bacterium]
MNAARRAEELLGAGGAFAGQLADFVPRAGQVRLAAEILAAIETGEHLVAEAGTGIGKTFAYLAPILAGHRRAVISTATRTLQDQIFEQDLPRAAGVLGRRHTAILKGRENYLCRERWLRLSGDLLGFEGTGFDRQRFESWVRSTRTGDLAEVSGLEERIGLRRMLTTSAEACPGSNCPEYGRCHVYAARREAQAAEVVIVNHHLLLADLRLKQEGVVEGLLGPADVVVVDEAHALPEVARGALGETVSWRQLEELARDVAEAFGGIAGVREAVQALNDTLKFSRLALPPGRHAWREAAGALLPVAEAVEAALAELGKELAAVPEAESLAARAGECTRRLARLAGDEPDNAPGFRWVEIGAKGKLSLHSSPLEPGETLAEWIAESGACWIFTSATLAVNGSFDNFTRQIGLDGLRHLLVGSPFDYEHQALLYLPSELPDVNDGRHTEAVVAAAEPLIRAAEGGSFLLFTSHRALRHGAELLRSRELGKPIFVQGEAPSARLLDNFRAAGNGILCGTASFWKGVDVKGEALVFVAIDRLPFASPGEPLFEARLQKCRAAGGNPFLDIQIPEAALALKQGAGRLIRDGSDRGVLMIGDPRLQTQWYGRVFRASLPPMRPTRDAEEAT